MTNCMPHFLAWLFLKDEQHPEELNLLFIQTEDLYKRETEREVAHVWEYRFLHLGSDTKGVECLFGGN